jgi:hypothetical protein
MRASAIRCLHAGNIGRWFVKAIGEVRQLAVALGVTPQKDVLINVCFCAHNRLIADIAPCPFCADFVAEVACCRLRLEPFRWERRH